MPVSLTATSTLAEPVPVSQAAGAPIFAIPQSSPNRGSFGVAAGVTAVGASNVCTR